MSTTRPLPTKPLPEKDNEEDSMMSPRDLIKMHRVGGVAASKEGIVVVSTRSYDESAKKWDEVCTTTAVDQTLMFLLQYYIISTTAVRRLSTVLTSSQRWLYRKKRNTAIRTSLGSQELSSKQTIRHASSVMSSPSFRIAQENRIRSHMDYASTTLED